ncbi:uncharacterized protein [Triticum aestivum]|uniref:uncharacterized protein n=1 Tax=Triticum aestivum TaxID=4565 RepID=UPI001D019801|nr:uncharacterized protein LOC123050581 [Triticum aestivum]
MAICFKRAVAWLRVITNSPWMVLSVSRHYAHGRFYWISGSSEKLLVLDIQRMEFSMADHPPAFSGGVAIVEAGQGMIRMFVRKPNAPLFVPTTHTEALRYMVWRNNGGISTRWQREKKTVSLDSGSVLTGAVGRHLLLYQCGRSSVQTGGFTLDVDTSQVERAHTMPLMSRERGAVLVPQVEEADPGGVQGPALAAAARAPNPLLVVNSDAEVGRGGQRRRRRWGWTCGGCRGW